MDYFHYQNGILHAEEVAIDTIAADIPTPFYCYSTATIERHYTVFRDAFADMDAVICYAMKANGNKAVLKTLSSLGAGADVVSGGEMERALAAGIDPKKIVFSGVGKTAAELSGALQAGVMQINVESTPELLVLNTIATQMGITAPVAVRVNPDVDAGTHEKITTGRRDNKFGIDMEHSERVIGLINELSHVRLQGIAMHIGSQLTHLAPYEKALHNVIALVERLRAAGQPIETLDVGGGLGIPYNAPAEHNITLPSPADYARCVASFTRTIGCKIILEPGRAIMGNAGIMVARVLYIKADGAQRFVIVDAGMNDLMRPALYEAWHDIIPINAPSDDSALSAYDVVGPVCESTDTFAKGRPLPPLQAGDLIAFRSAGAYAAAMASAYNARPLPAEVMVKGDTWAGIREPITAAQFMSHEQFAPWQQS